MPYPWLWAHRVFEDFLAVRRSSAAEEMIAQEISYDDVVELVRSDPQGWNAFKQQVRLRERLRDQQ